MAFWRRGGLITIALVAAVLGTAWGGGAAESLPQKNPADEASAELVQARLKQLDAAAGMDDAAKAKIHELYEQGLRELEAEKNWVAKTVRFEQTAAAAPEELRRTKATLAAMPSQPRAEVPPTTTLAQLSQEISKREAELNQGRIASAELDAEPKRRAARRVEIPKAIGAARDRLADVEKQLQAAPPPEEPAEVTTARRLALVVKKRSAEAELAAYDAETKAYEATTELLPVRRDVAARQVALVEQEVKQWREALNRRREREAETQVRKAWREATEAHPAVRKLAQDNAALAEMRKALAQQIADTTQQLEQTHQRVSDLKEQFNRIKEKVETVGRTNSIGLLLRKQRETLPSVGYHRRNISVRQLEIREGQLAILQLEDRRSPLANLELKVRGVLDNLDRTQRPADRRELEAAVREMLKSEKEYLDALIGDHNTYFDKLVELDNAERQLIDQTEACAQYIDERVLWIASAQPMGVGDLRHALDALAWLALPEGWQGLGLALAADVQNNPLVWIVALAALGLLVRVRGRLRRELTAIGEQTIRANCFRFLPTLKALAISVLRTLTVPAALWLLAWRLSIDLDAPALCKAVGAGLAAVARSWFVFGLIGQLCHPQGLGAAHFEWNTAGLRMLRSQMRWFLLAVAPLIFLSAAMAAQENERWRDSLGRAAFIAAACCFALLLQRVLRPGGTVFENLLAPQRDGWFDRLRYVWYPLAMLHPLVLAAMAAAGYCYTSQQLGRRIFSTICILLGLFVLRALLLRWVLVNRRKLAIEQARQRRAAAQAESAAAVESAPAAGAVPCPDPNRDLATINSQTRRLVEYSLGLAGILALWFAWVDILPALRVLDHVELWHTTISATETVPGPEGTASLRTVERLAAVTLADAGLAMLVLATMLIAVKNIPGLLEMGLLQHLPLDASVRYAIGAVSRYVITMVGLLVAFNVVGLGWSRVQWLLAAISVGLGFGLQEIFANFVSGLIILFERPVRVGDVITIGDVTGVVSRIRMRATTVTNWDRKELIIPNKEFITGRVLNWTLSDQINRVVINVGVAYGSDSRLATDLLLAVARNHPMVLTDPPPRATLEGFGSSSLDFVLRCFLPNLESRLAAIHELHMEIDRVFREAGIEIAFPQQDIHVRSLHLSPELLDAAAGEGPRRHAA